MCQAFTQCFTQLYHVIFTTSVRGGCYCHPHFTHKETNAHRRQGHAQGHTSKSLAELGLQPGFKIQAHCTGLTCFLLQKRIQNLKIGSEEHSVVWLAGPPSMANRAIQDRLSRVCSHSPRYSLLSGMSSVRLHVNSEIVVQRLWLQCPVGR